MNILLFTSSLSFNSGGTGFEVANLASELVQVQDIDVTILTYGRKSPQYPVHSSVNLKLLNFRLKPCKLVEHLKLIRQTFLNSDVIFATGIWGIRDGCALRIFRPAQVPCYIRICGMLQPYILNRNPWKKAIGRLLYVNHNLSQSDGLIVNSAAEALQVKSLGFKTPIHVIPNGFTAPSSLPSHEEARLAFNISQHARVLLYIGRIHPKKGLHKLLLSMADRTNLLSVCDAASMLIAGEFSDHAYETQIRNLAKLVPSKLDIKFLGDIRGYSKELAFAASDVFVLPSESEGLPNAALEAMARGKPVALTPECNLHEVATFGAGIIFSLDNKGLNEALQWMLGPSEILLNSGLRARELFDSHFSSVTMVQQYLRLMRRRNWLPCHQTSR